MNLPTAADLPLFLLVLARVGGTLALAPIFGSAALPAGVKVGIALALSVAFFPIAPRASAAPAGLDLVPAVSLETAIGVAMGFAAWLLFAAVQSGGALLDQELGLSVAAVFDPVSAEPAGLVSQFKLLLAGAAYVLCDGHHLLLSALAESWRALPPGGAVAPAAGPEFVAAIGSTLFSGAVKVAAPALVAVFAVTVATAFIARALPEAGSALSAMPLRLVAGLLALALGTGAFVSGFAASVREGGDAVHSVVTWMGGRP